MSTTATVLCSTSAKISTARCGLTLESRKRPRRSFGRRAARERLEVPVSTGGVALPVCRL